jgi:hypothetical protein
LPVVNRRWPPARTGVTHKSYSGNCLSHRLSRSHQDPLADSTSYNNNRGVPLSEKLVLQST